MKRIAAIVCAFLLGPVALVLLRTAVLESRQVEVPPASTLAVDVDRVAAHLGELIRIPTLSRGDGTSAPMDAVHGWLRATYPRVHAAMQQEVVGDGALLYTWHGTEPELDPVLFMAHLDVVPADADGWTHPPFEGVVDGGFVWGRGALDVKVGVVGLMEGVTALLAEGWRPRRTLLIEFGCDEEVGGSRGASLVARALEERGVHLAWVLDEGLPVLEGIIDGLSVPVAPIAVAEKGYLSVELTARDAGGHSSTPPSWTASGRVARAVARLEEDPFPAALDEPLRSMLAGLAPEMPFAERAALANLWLFGPLVERAYAGKRSTDALLRTTTAPTVLEGSLKDNVLPRTARAVVNFRIHPRDSIAGVLARISEEVADPEIEISSLNRSFASEPARISRDAGPGWSAIERAIRQTTPGVVVVPGLLTGATDSRHFAHLADDIYRFLPLTLGPEDLARPHGVDERVALSDLAQAVRFYALVLRLAGDQSPPVN